MQRKPAFYKVFVTASCVTALAMALSLPFSELAAQSPVAKSAADPSPQLIEDLVAACHALAQQGVLDAYGHVSARHDHNPNHYLMARHIAPELVTAADIMEFDLDSSAIDPKGREGYGERFIHGEIYKARPDVNVVVHFHSPAVIPFGITNIPLRPVYHMAAFLGEGVPIFDPRKLEGATDLQVTNSRRGRALAEVMGKKSSVLMRGHGAVVVGKNFTQAVGRSIYMVTNAQIQLQVLALGSPITYMEQDESSQPTLDRYDTGWDLWRRKGLGK